MLVLVEFYLGVAIVRRDAYRRAFMLYVFDSQFVMDKHLIFGFC